MTSFTPIASAFGGALIGLASVLLMAYEGRIAGISGIAGRILPPYGDDALLSRIAFVAGLLIAPLVMLYVTQEPVRQVVSANLPLMAVAGLLVGFGSTFGNGCTSGHGVCGLSRLSPRSLVATLTFMTAGFITVFVTRHLLGV